MEKQEFRKAWCPICEYETMFIQHADLKKRWICTSGKCFKYTTEELMKKPTKAQITHKTLLSMSKKEREEYRKIKDRLNTQLNITGG